MDGAWRLRGTKLVWKVGHHVLKLARAGVDSDAARSTRPKMKKLLDYELLEPLSSGKLTSVHRARRTHDGLSVVIKGPASSASTREAVAVLRNENSILMRLKSPRIVGRHDFVTTGKESVLVLEDCGTSSLAQLMESRRIELAEGIQIAIALTLAVGDVHANHVIHKDINPYNFVFDARSQRWKVIDFGISTSVKSEVQRQSTPGELEGTLFYVSPEQTGRMNRRLDYRTDLYSLGVTLYQLFTGRVPHPSSDPMTLVHAHLAIEPPEPCNVDSTVPPVLSTMIMKLLKKAAEDRYQSASGLLADLETCAQQLADTGRIEPFPLFRNDIWRQLEPPQRLHGRDGERQRLIDAFDRAAEGHVVSVLVSGPSGIGKTALVQELNEPVTQRRGYVATGKFDALQYDVPYSAWVQALHELIGQLLTEDDRALERWRERILSAVGRNGGIMVDLVPALELVIGPQAPVSELFGVEAQHRFQLVFTSFFQLFCKRQHPLVLVFDDTQWADSASLNLITQILSVADTESLLFIQTFRGNEITEEHPFALAVREQERRGIAFERLELGPLDETQTAALIAEAVHEDPIEVRALAAITWRKTGGSPFFVRQFLHDLYESGLIAFDADVQRFVWSACEIMQASATENVVDLLRARLEKLPHETRDALSKAAAIGTQFSLPALCAIVHRPVSEVAEILAPAVREELIEALSPKAIHSRENQVERFRPTHAFLHDRVRDAAYARIPAVEQSRVHLGIGRWLLEADPEPEDRQLFEIVRHLNDGRALIESQGERTRLVDLNVRAGLKSLRSTAYQLATSSFQVAVALLGGDGWTFAYERTFEAHLRLGESLYLNLDTLSALDVFDVAAARARDNIDEAKALTSKTRVYVSMGQVEESLRCGLAAAGLLGFEVPRNVEDVREDLGREIAIILAKTSKESIENFLDLPIMRDPDKTALMQLLMCCIPPAYQSNAELFALICCKMVTLSFEYGNHLASAKGYGSFAVILGGVLGNYRDAYRFGKLGVDLAHRLDGSSVMSATYFTHGAFAAGWCSHVDESVQLLRKAIVLGLESGDHTHVGSSARFAISHLLFGSAHLADLREELERYQVLLDRLGEVSSLLHLRPVLQLVKMLQGELREGQRLNDESFDEAAHAEAVTATGNHTLANQYDIIRLIHRFWSDDFAGALEFARRAAAGISASVGKLAVAEHNLYYSLTLTALLKSVDEETRAEFESILAANQEQMSLWAESSPENFGHKYLLVEAERARLTGAFADAMALYDQSITWAVEAGFSNMVAIGSVLAGRFWLARNQPEFAGVHLRRADRAFGEWGATAKQRQLRRVHRKLVMPEPTTWSGDPMLLTLTQNGETLDLSNVVKAGHAIAGEIDLGRLLTRLMNIVTEGAGAQCASLLLKQETGWVVQAARAVDGRVQVLQNVPLQDAPDLCAGIVNYVTRTGEHMVLDDATTHVRFGIDPCIQSRHTKSVLCMPIRHKGTLKGVLYAENNLAPGMFTSARLRALEILTSQISTSIENAILFEEQKRQSAEIAKTNADLRLEVGERTRAEAELARYRDHLEELVAERTQALQAAQSRLIAMSRAAGMAEVATGVLHNVGNILNSVKVSVELLHQGLDTLRLPQLQRVVDLLNAHEDTLSEFLASDPRGQKLVPFMALVTADLHRVRDDMLVETQCLRDRVAHMEVVVSKQQDYASSAAVLEACTTAELVRQALALLAPSRGREGLALHVDCEDKSVVRVERHRVLEILVNLLSNAVQSIEASRPSGSDGASRPSGSDGASRPSGSDGASRPSGSDGASRPSGSDGASRPSGSDGASRPSGSDGASEASARGELKLTSWLSGDGRFFIRVTDNGVGIRAEHAAKIFTSGFTTKPDGHGFGLHNSCNAAQAMGGALQCTSEGPGRGATFTLELPVERGVLRTRAAG